MILYSSFLCHTGRSFWICQHPFSWFFFFSSYMLKGQKMSHSQPTTLFFLSPLLNSLELHFFSLHDEWWKTAPIHFFAICFLKYKWIAFTLVAWNYGSCFSKGRYCLGTYIFSTVLIKQSIPISGNKWNRNSLTKWCATVCLSFPSLAISSPLWRANCTGQVNDISTLAICDPHTEPH